MAEGYLARLLALRALAVFVCTALLLVCLASGAWAGPEAPMEPRSLDLRQATVNKEVDGWLHVQIDDAGRVIGVISEAMAWRLEVSSAAEPDSDGLIFNIAPAGDDASEQPCWPGEICPAGYSVGATSRAVNLEPLRRTQDATGAAVFRQAATVVMPLDLTWVKFYASFHAAVAEACRGGLQTALAAGRPLEALRRDSINPRLTFPLKAAVFAGVQIAETQVAVNLRCWGSGFSRDELAKGLVPARYF